MSTYSSRCPPNRRRTVAPAEVAAAGTAIRLPGARAWELLGRVATFNPGDETLRYRLPAIVAASPIGRGPLPRGSTGLLRPTRLRARPWPVLPPRTTRLPGLVDGSGIPGRAVCERLLRLTASPTGFGSAALYAP